ncbi:unnamed protein product [Caenorhabditis brenneri]
MSKEVCYDNPEFKDSPITTQPTCENSVTDGMQDEEGLSKISTFCSPTLDCCCSCWCELCCESILPGFIEGFFEGLCSCD